MSESTTTRLLQLIDEVDKESGASANMIARQRFAAAAGQRATPTSPERALKEYRALVAEEKQKEAERKAAKHAVAKANRSKRRKETLRRKTSRQNFGVTAGRQPRRSHKPSGRPIRHELEAA